MDKSPKELFLNPSYIGPRPDILQLIPSSVLKVLDVGCATGELGKSIKARSTVHVTGIEMAPEMAEIARNQLDEVFVGDADQILTNGLLGNSRFDVIIFADVLEHVPDPWNVLTRAKDYLTHDGIVIASIPNVRHIDTIFNLVFKGYWPYRDRGIHDRTHLRFFTKKNIIELFDNAGMDISKIKVNYRIVEAPSDKNRFAHRFALPIIREFLAFQYIIVGCASNRSRSDS